MSGRPILVRCTKVSSYLGLVRRQQRAYTHLSSLQIPRQHKRSALSIDRQALRVQPLQSLTTAAAASELSFSWNFSRENYKYFRRFGQGRRFVSDSKTKPYNVERTNKNNNLAATSDDDKPASNKPTASWDTLRRIVAFSRPEHSWIYWSAATLVVTSSTTLILPTASGKVLDMIISGDSGTSPTLVAAGLFGLTALAGGGVYARTLWLQRAGNTLTARLKHQLYQSMLRQEMAYYDKDMNTGDLLTRLSSDTQLIQAAVTTQTVSALRALVMSTGSTVLLFQTSTTLALVSLGTLPPLFLAARQVGASLREQQTRVQELHSRATSVAEEGLQGIQTVVQFGAESQQWHRYQTAVTHAHNQAIETGRTQALFDGAVHVAANGAILCVLGYGGSLVVKNVITPGELTGFLMYSLLLAGNVSSLSSTYAEVMKAVAAADRVFEVMDRKPAIPSEWKEESHADLAASTSRDQHQPLSIEFRNLQFSYPTRPERTILGPRFSLSVHPGEVLAVVGGSGSGKSTMARLLTRLYDIDDAHINGSSDSAILVGGRDIREWNPSDLRRSIVGIVSQEPLLFDGSIEDNIRYGRPNATHEEVLEAAKLAHVQEFVEHFSMGLQTKVGPRGTQLSGGQKQRVAIARLLIKDPPVVILDEATSALDAESEYFVKQALDSVMKGRTVISIAHRLSTIRGADRIAVLQDGQVAEVGTFEELAAKETSAFRSLMGRQLIS